LELKIVTEPIHSESHQPVEGDKPRPFEVAFTILVAIAAITAAFAGFMAVKASNEAKERMGMAEIGVQTWYQLMNLETLLYYDQIDKLNQADVAESEGRIASARMIRNQTNFVKWGYLTPDGEPTANYSSYDSAIQIYYSNQMNGTLFAAPDFRWSGEEYEKASKKSEYYLLSTVMLSTAIVYGTVGMSASQYKIRRAFVILLTAFILISVIFIAVTAQLQLAGLLNIIFYTSIFFLLWGVYRLVRTFPPRR
jgi:hypothetical protein